MLKETFAMEMPGLVEQGSSLGNKVNKMPSGSKVRCHGKETEMLLTTLGRKSAAKAHRELKLARIVGDNKKRFLKYINGKRRCRNIISVLQDKDGHVTDRDMDKAEVFNAFFASVFNTDPGGCQLLSWRTKALRMINTITAQLTLRLHRLCSFS